MKSITPALTALAALCSTVVAQNQQSKPFYLVAVSTNKTVDGTHFSACHEGAGIEALCVGPKKVPSKTAAYYTYRLNNTDSQPNQGVLSWLLPSGNSVSYSEPMTLYSDPTTNVALPLFEPSEGNTQNVAFDKDNKMYISGYINDKVTPPTGGKEYDLYNWYTCETYYTGYTYHTLSWLLGTAYPPQNPSCEKVDVVRVFT